MEVSPNLWAGVGLVRGGAGTALVGSPETVAERLREYQSLGIDTIVGSGYPHLEEAYRVAELLFPVLNGSKAAAHETRFENIATHIPEQHPVTAPPEFAGQKPFAAASAS